MNPDYPRPPKCTCGSSDTSHDSMCDLALIAMQDLGVAPEMVEKLQAAAREARAKQHRGPGGGRYKGRPVEKRKTKPKRKSSLTKKTLEQRLADGDWLSHNELRRLKRQQREA